MELVSALVCTRNRPRSVPHVVSSLLAATGPLEVLVVDQSDDARTEQALEPWRADARLRYLYSATRGKGAALNEGLRAAHGSIVVCTDDDCRVPPNWARDMAERLVSEPSAAIAFCRVAAVPHDEQRGYVPAYDVARNRLLRSIEAAGGGIGLGAAMAVRRDFVLSLGGFDEAFGPGGRFPSGDDYDIAMRALLKGAHVLEIADLTVIHDGFRAFSEGREHARRDWLALGAVCAKPLRAGYLRAIVVPLRFFPSRALWPPLSDVLHFRRPRGFVRIVSFVRGFADGLATRVDSRSLRYSAKR